MAHSMVRPRVTNLMPWGDIHFSGHGPYQAKEVPGRIGQWGVYDEVSGRHAIAFPHATVAVVLSREQAQKLSDHLNTLRSG